jgi:nucleoside 2-deoxyribosyltransferase
MIEPSIYLGGTIDRLNPDMVIDYFSETQLALQAIGFKVYNPVRGKVVGSNEFKQYEDNEIVHRDLADIDKSDLMLAMMAKPSIGTSMEIMYSRMVKNIPVIVVSTDLAVTQHYWVNSLASKVMASRDEAIEYIRRWYI